MEKEIFGLSGIEEVLANKEAEQSIKEPHSICGKIECDCDEQYEDYVANNE